MGDKKLQQIAGERFLANMSKTEFVTTMLFEAGVNRPPCVCCLRRAQKTCVRDVGEFNCPNYELFSAVPAEVEGKYLRFVRTVHQQEHLRRKPAATNIFNILQFQR